MAQLHIAGRLSAGALPAGLSLASSTGVISGTPTTAGTVSFTVQVTDAANNTATKALSIAVAAAAQPPRDHNHITAWRYGRYSVLDNAASEWWHNSI